MKQIKKKLIQLFMAKSSISQENILKFLKNKMFVFSALNHLRSQIQLLKP